MRKGFSIFAAICLAFITGCASSRQFVPLPDQGKRVDDPSKGRIYVMRPASGFWENGTMNISEDGKFIGRTGPRGFICWERRPGATIVTGKAEGISQAPLTIEPGGVYFIFEHVRMGFLMARNELEVLDEQRGKEVLKHCHPAKIAPAPPSGFSVSKEPEHSR